MQIEVEDVLFWMDAIRNSKDRYRTLESFWKGQVRSKIWLIEKLKEHINLDLNEIVIHGGWNGVLASLLFNSNISINKIVSLDIDPVCEEIASTINKRQEIDSKFTAITNDMCSYKYETIPDVVINTSCEHINDDQIKSWFDKIPKNTLVVMQSNNFYELEEHMNCVNSAEELSQKVNLRSFNTYEFETPKYTRFMMIGRK